MDLATVAFCSSEIDLAPVVFYSSEIDLAPFVFYSSEIDLATVNFIAQRLIWHLSYLVNKILIWHLLYFVAQRLIDFAHFAMGRVNSDVIARGFKICHRTFGPGTFHLSNASGLLIHRLKYPLKARKYLFIEVLRVKNSHDHDTFH